MDPFTAAALVYITGKIGDKLIDRGLDKHLDALSEKILPKTTFQDRLRVVVDKTIKEFEKKENFQNKTKQFYFYESEILFTQVLESQIYQDIENPLKYENFEGNLNIITPTQADLNNFFNIFLKNIEADEDLRKLYIDQYYKEEIFKLSSKIDKIVNNKIYENDSKGLLNNEIINNYLNKNINKSEFQNIDKIYVMLTGQKYVHDIDQHAKKVNEGRYFDKFNEGIFDNEYGVFDEEDFDEIIPIIDLINKVDKLIILGTAGSGKTTTIQKIFSTTIQHRNINPQEYLPVIIKIKKYKPNSELETLISTEIGLDVEEIKKMLISGDFYIFIDGLNEIGDNIKNEAYDDLKDFLSKYPTNKYLITTRKHTFNNIFDLPVYDLKELNEIQIKEYIQKYLEFYNKKIDYDLWGKLKDDINIISLTKNPLTLRMLVFLTLNDNIVINRGKLYESFIKYIYKREINKDIKFDIVLKNDILAYCALDMRKKGINQLSIEETRKLVNKKVNNIILTNKIVLELLEINLLVIDNEKNISFLHDTYLEYFSALEINNNFITNKVLDIANIEDSKWDDTLLMCSDLLLRSSDKHRFFEYLFVGEKKKEPKNLHMFDYDDVNDTVLVACKIANNLRNSNPKVFQTAESYILNYITLYMIYKEDNRIINSKKLFSCIAALNSRKALRKIFYEEKWQIYWLYSDDEDENIERTEKQNIEETNFLNIAKYLIDNLSNYAETLQFIHEFNLNIYSSKLAAMFSKSIKRRVSYLLTEIYKKISSEELIAIYNRNPNIYTLQIIGRRDINFFVNNYDIELFGEDKFIETLIKFHDYSNLLLEKNLLRAIIDNKVRYKTLLKVIQKLCTIYFINEKYLSLGNLYTILENSDNSYSKISIIINFSKKINFNNIPENIKNTLLEEYQLFSSKKDKILNQFRDTNILDLFKRKKEFQIQYFDFKINPNNKKNIFILLTKYSDNRYIEVGDPFVINGYILGLVNSINEVDIIKNEKEYAIIKTGKIVWQSKRVDKIGLNNVYYISADIFSTNMENISAEGTISSVLHFTNPKNLINILIENRNILNFFINQNIFARIHPDLVVNDTELVSYIISNITEYNFIIYNLNISFLFYGKTRSFEPGLILAISTYFAIVLKLRTGELKALPIPQSFRNSFNVKKYVIIENNNNIHQIENIDINENNGFKKSGIISVNYLKKTGFIHNLFSTKDYFFSFKECDFIPEIGDEVFFISRTNEYEKYKNYLIAINIRFIRRLYCRLKTIEEVNEYFTGMAIDTITNEEIQYSIKANNVLNGKLFIDKIYKYIPSKRHGNFSANRATLLFPHLR
ncbi:NACHT domain-containing protein [Spirosoma endbachense]|uniref:NACHT domain-containing protein n=1 Tax=Spirosoma endbachense TaxID=2666025 RepID=A0A6P1W5T9_9BACT|nr:NACHT domain-containing protein [Spirosoma endbachense]QHV99300.1 NACHT domain-containing protein [Spirosoma endbachense]